MSDKKLAMLAVVAVVMVILAVVVSHISSAPVESDAPGYLIPGLNVARIGSIVIGKGADIVTLKRSKGRFVVTNKDDYPAKASEINNLLTKCQEISRLQLITDNPVNHKDLEVAEENAHSIVRFLTPEPNSTIIAGIVAGKTKEAKSGGTGSYVRLLTNDKKMSDKVYLAHNIPWFSSQAKDYIERKITACKTEDIESVTVSSSDDQYTLKAKQDSKDIVLENTPQGKKLKADDASRVFNALNDLRFEDVTKRTSGLLFNRKYICRLKNSTVYTIDIAQKDNQTYIICSADFTDTVEKPTKDETEEQLKGKEAVLLAWEKATQFTDKHKGWIYTITENKAKNLTKPLSDLLEIDDTPKETETPEEPDSAAIEEVIESLDNKDVNAEP